MLRAILEDALISVQTHTCKHKDECTACATLAWVMVALTPEQKTASFNRCFTFTFICETLGLDAGALRLLFLQKKQHRRFRHRQPYYKTHRIRAQRGINQR